MISSVQANFIDKAFITNGMVSTGSRAKRSLALEQVTMAGEKSLLAGRNPEQTQTWFGRTLLLMANG